MDYYLDWLLLILHLALVLFNLGGWAWRRTRRVHLGVILLTLGSWVGLGYFYGWGYCVLTDWQWEVKRRLGETELANSWVKHYVDRATGLDCDPWLIDIATVALAVTAFALSIGLNWRDWRREAAS